MSPLLTATNICKQFPGVLALDRVSLAVGRGEVVAIVGENGAGKSTLMKVIAGVYHAESGELVWDGHAAKEVGIGYGRLLQSYGVFKTLREAVFLLSLAFLKVKTANS